MVKIPEQVISAWQERSGPAVIATASEDGVPNAIYSAYTQQYNENAFIITDHFFNKTRNNIMHGSKGALLFLSNDGKSSFQLKGTFEYHEDGEVIEQLRKSMPPELPSRAAVIFNIVSVYSGGEKIG
ncbi:MAG TPA: pyridoxamine 5'-phosphate oxidase family protein [Gammaproteobacteria bacterium]|nr:pyridoxamine 5'-phosphate oxidase family protein [Gammaproteobacteria bacterium]